MDTTLNCQSNRRRSALFDNPQWNGIDYLEVSDDQRSLCVHFFGRVPSEIKLSNIVIEGGRRIRDIRAIQVEIDQSEDPELDSCLRITIDKPGDFSVYRLCLLEPTRVPITECVTAGTTKSSQNQPASRLDPRYACLDFRFKLDCLSDFDCKLAPVCVDPVLPVPEINYLAKDYASFRQLMLDRLALTVPDWHERHVPDLGITLVEMLAYVADQLSYYQDAVGTEAYLDTARQRISVRRHTRLVGYTMHEGNNARAWLCLSTDSDVPDIPANVYFVTSTEELMGSGKHVIEPAELKVLPGSAYKIYEPVLAADARTFAIYAAHSEINFYTWGDTECCLARGATRATLLDQAAYPAEESPELAPRMLKNLKVGDILIFEEIKGPLTGNPADANLTHRHAVRLTRVEPTADELLRRLVVEIEWSREDALPFALCLSTRLPAPDCGQIDNVSVVHGNVILVDHGKTIDVDEEIGTVAVEVVRDECACDGSVTESSFVPKKFTATLKWAPLTYTHSVLAGSPATAQLQQDPRAALPVVSLISRSGGTDAAELPWSVQRDLLASSSRDAHYVVEMDDESRAHLRFGDGDLGASPDVDAVFSARYRIGNGTSGNVAAEAIAIMVTPPGGAISGANIHPRNPLPAQGGIDPETVTEARLFAPYAFRRELMRAITADDYAQLAGGHGQIQRAAAQLSWTGSWYEARVALDVYGAESASPAVCNDILALLHRYRRMGHDLAVVPARYVPLEVALLVCVQQNFLRGHVEKALTEIFGNARLSDGRLGFFHPDRLSFGSSIYASEIIALAQAVEGVESVRLATLQRVNEVASVEQGPRELAQGVLKLASWEIPQLDNDPDFPEHGKFTITLRGGR